MNVLSAANVRTIKVGTLPPPSPRLPRVRDDLTIQAISATEYVIKRRESREYFSVGPQEACLLELLNGKNSFSDIQKVYFQRFEQHLSEADLGEFLQAVQPMGLLQSTSKSRTGSRSPQPDGSSERADHTPDSAPSADSESVRPKKKSPLNGQSVLFFRIPLCDPDVFLGRIVNRIPFVWTRGFLIFSGCVMLVALCVMISSSQLLVAGISRNHGWSDAILFLCVMLGCTSLHEMAHGATLKRFGGEVHDSGLLFMFFTPCLYCNVSDAWLIPDKWKRLAITAAGGYCDLCMWAASVFVWRVTVIGTPINQIAFLVLTICGGRSFLNFNPMLRLDGYYLLSDWLSIPNLRPRAMDYWMSHLRWILWGAAPPPALPEKRVLLLYGCMCWVFAIGFLDLIFVRFFEYMGGQFGVVGLIFVGLLLSFGLRRVFKGFFASEFATMLKSRSGRTTTWAVALLSLTALLFLVPVKSTTSGDFEVRPGNIVQVHVPVAGIVERILIEDGSVVEAGQLIAELKSPTLESEIVQTEDMLREVEANLKRLKTGARPEEVEAAADRVRRLTEWYELGAEDLQQAKIAHTQDMLVQEHRIRETVAALDNAKQDILQSERLYRLGALAGAQLRQQRLEVLQTESKLAQVQAATNASKAMGVRSKEAEVSRRAQELADAKAQLDLLKAGSRPEDIAAEEARKARAEHELAFQKSRREKLQLVAPTSGIFSAPRLKERIGLAVLQDSLFCTIEKPETSRVEISVSEDDAAHVKPGQAVTLKARAIPFETFGATVEGISPVAQKTVTTGQNFVVVHCQIQNPDGRLKSGMTGFGRVTRGWNTIGVMLVTKGIRYLRTEFWW